jgi:anaerobic selenocysteine-containing dehydrogenase
VACELQQDVHEINPADAARGIKDGAWVCVGSRDGWRKACRMKALVTERVGKGAPDAVHFAGLVQGVDQRST